MKYQVRLASGSSIEAFEEECNKLAQLRQQEIDAALDRGEDVMVLNQEFFVPSGPVGYANGRYFQVWTRWI
ncbi:MAG: hypothetical protein ACYSW3_00475 [Planctomycetota bacterium]|jgi:hypothetical protein